MVFANVHVSVQFERVCNQIVGYSKPLLPNININNLLIRLFVGAAQLI